MKAFPHRRSIRRILFYWWLSLRGSQNLSQLHSKCLACNWNDTPEHTESMRNEVPLMLSPRRMTIPLCWSGAEWHFPVLIVVIPNMATWSWHFGTMTDNLGKGLTVCPLFKYLPVCLNQSDNDTSFYPADSLSVLARMSVWNFYFPVKLRSGYVRQSARMPVCLSSGSMRSHLPPFAAICLHG